MENIDHKIKQQKFILNIIGYVFIGSIFMFLYVGLTTAKKPFQFGFEMDFQQMFFTGVCLVEVLIILFIEKLIKNLKNKSLDASNDEERFNQLYPKWHMYKMIQLTTAETIGLYGFVLINQYNSSMIYNALFFVASLVLLIKYRPDINQFVTILKSDKYSVGYKTG